MMASCGTLLFVVPGPMAPASENHAHTLISLVSYQQTFSEGLSALHRLD
jgi:hypothetical protein